MSGKKGIEPGDQLLIFARRLTILLDRPMSISEDDIDTPFPEYCAELDHPVEEGNLQNLQENVKVIKLLSRTARYVNLTSHALHPPTDCVDKIG